MYKNICRWNILDIDFICFIFMLKGLGMKRSKLGINLIKELQITITTITITIK